jgi:hypothetical protein
MFKVYCHLKYKLFHFCKIRGSHGSGYEEYFIFSNVTPCSFVQYYQRFRGTWWPHFLPWIWRLPVLPVNRDSIPDRSRRNSIKTDPCTHPDTIWPGFLSLGVKRFGRDANHTHPLSVEIKNTWSSTSSFFIRLPGVMLIKHRDNFASTFTQMTVLLFCWVWCSHTGDYEEWYIFRYDVSEKRRWTFTALHGVTSHKTVLLMFRHTLYFIYLISVGIVRSRTKAVEFSFLILEST